MRIQIQGCGFADEIETHGGRLLLGNHLAFMDTSSSNLNCSLQNLRRFARRTSPQCTHDCAHRHGRLQPFSAHVADDDEHAPTALVQNAKEISSDLFCRGIDTFDFEARHIDRRCYQLLLNLPCRVKLHAQFIPSPPRFPGSLSKHQEQRKLTEKE